MYRQPNHFKKHWYTQKLNKEKKTFIISEKINTNFQATYVLIKKQNNLDNNLKQLYEVQFLS